MATKPKNQITRKKVKVIGTQQYVNPEDGTYHDFQVVSIEEKDFNFHKIWLKNFINAIDLIGNKKTELAFWIIDHVNKENQLVMTYDQIAKASGISRDTVRKTMAILIESDFLQRINMGAYMINPDIIFKGTRNGRLNVLNQYRDIGTEHTITDEERLVNLELMAEKIQKNINSIKERMLQKTQSNADIAS